jgi:Aldose 1-epimerase
MHSATSSPRRARPAGRPRIVVPTVLALAAVAVLGASALAQGKQAHAAALKNHRAPVGNRRRQGGQALQPVQRVDEGQHHQLGGIIQSIDVPGRNGKVADVSLGFKNLKGYQANDATRQPAGGSGTTCFGAIIGRFGNRIAKGKFTLNGTTYHLPINNGPNTLHGGTNAWNKQVWAPKTVLRRLARADLHEPQRPGRLPGHRRRPGHVHPGRLERPDHPLRRDHRQADGRQHDQPHVLQPRR